MADISGALTSVELVPLIRFLASMRKTGDLLVSSGSWIGQVSLDNGRIIAATVEHDHGMPALEFLALVMSDGQFEFSGGTPSLVPDPTLPADPWTHLDAIAANRPAWIRRLPPPSAVPNLLAPGADIDEATVSLGRGALYVLLDIDGYLTVRAIAGRHGLRRTFRALAELNDLGLIAFDEPTDRDRDPSSTSSQAPPRPRGTPPADAAPQTPANLKAVGTASQATSMGPSFARRLQAWRGSDRMRRSLSLGVDMAQALAVAGVLVLLTRSVIQNFRVEGTSMEPSFAGGEVLVVNRAAYFHVANDYLFGGPQRGDVVVFRAPPQPDADYIKRLIGLPGDSIRVSQGRVYVNDEVVDEPYIKFPATYTFPTDGKVAVVPDNMYFVLGDNRPESFDSHLGWFVPVENLIGRAWLRYWPPQSWGVVEPGDNGPGSSLASESPQIR